MEWKAEETHTLTMRGNNQRSIPKIALNETMGLTSRHSPDFGQSAKPKTCRLLILAIAEGKNYIERVVGKIVEDIDKPWKTHRRIKKTKVHQTIVVDQIATARV
ncbi:hypothetical protein A0H81_06232 [Grifola frondosa]|uniref:Uncharacterized protein n=1 Tax=Grifola frondosa TaxID=5627 RepID=A0A1C7MA30_GRIFR|nr:hypothetical protein A0H81_06232 [Grifola frondosa]